MAIGTIRILKMKRKEKAFTLIEILAAFVIFSLIVIAISTIFIMSMRAQKSSLGKEKLNDQLNYAVEYMSRSIRMAKKSTGSCSIVSGTNYYPTSGYSNQLTFIKIEEGSPDPKCIRYYLSDNKIVNEIDGLDFDLTSDNIKITNLQFYITGGLDSDSQQPKVTILIEAESISQDPKETIRVQTTISQRDLDVN